MVSASASSAGSRHRVARGSTGSLARATDARAVAVRALSERRGLDVAGGQAKEVSATSSKPKARTDWTFTFADLTIAPLPQGEPRIAVEIAGGEVVADRPFGLRAGSLGAAAAGGRDPGLDHPDCRHVRVRPACWSAPAILAMMAWSRRKYLPPVRARRRNHAAGVGGAQLQQLPHRPGRADHRGAAPTPDPRRDWRRPWSA